MILTDNPSNTEFVYIYVSKFKWTSPVDSEKFSGHPKEKTLYRGFINTDTKNYRLIYNDSDNPEAVYIQTLKSNAPEMEGFMIDASVLSLDTILDFDLSEGDLDKLIRWMSLEFSDIKERLNGFKKQQPNVITVPIVSIARPEEDNDLNEFIGCAIGLYELNPAIIGSIHDLVHFLSEEETGESADNPLHLNKEHGAGANISSAMKNLETYIGSDRRTNLDESDLFLAIKHLLNEQTRRTIHEIR